MCQTAANTTVLFDLAPRAQILISVDGGPQSGYGHVGRCLALWDELGGACVFAVSEPGVAGYLHERGVALAAGTDAPASVIVFDHARSVDAEEVLRRQRAGSRVVLVDDAGPGRALADVVVDPPTGPYWPPSGGRRLAGFEHALLRRDIRAASPMGGVGVLVSLGGSDPTRLTPRVIDALETAGLSAQAALGPGYIGPAPARVAAPADWPLALAGARLLVTRFGHTLLEAAHLGVPAVALAVDERDRAEAQAFAAHGSARWLESEDSAGLVALVAELLDDDAARVEMSRRGRNLVDGLGARRVAGVLAEFT